MKNFKLRIGKRFFLSKSSLFGDIYFEFQDALFPEKNWNDFILIILHWWLEAIKNLKLDKKTKFLFMDGPYEISLILTDQNECEISFLHERINNKDLIKKVKVPLKFLISELLSGVESLEEAIRAPESVLLLTGPDTVESVVPSELKNRIKSNPSVLKEYNDLKNSYHSILENKAKLLEF